MSSPESITLRIQTRDGSENTGDLTTEVSLKHPWLISLEPSAPIQVLILPNGNPLSALLLASLVTATQSTEKTATKDQ